MNKNISKLNSAICGGEDYIMTKLALSQDCKNCFRSENPFIVLLHSLIKAESHMIIYIDAGENRIKKKLGLN